MIIMKQTKQLGLAMMAMALLALVSCSKTNKQGRLVPQNASYVMHINGEQLSAKINWDEIKGNESMKEFLSDSTLPAYISKVLQNPTESGIDLKKDMLVYAVIDDMGGYIAFTGTVLNADKFRNFNLDLTEGGFEREEKGVKYISKMPMIVGYDKEKFVYVANLPELNEGRRRGGEEGKTSRDVQQTAINIFQLSEDKSLGKNSKFTTLLKDGGDIHIWMNSEELAKGSGVEMVPLVNIEKFTKDNISTATLTFNNGNISLKSRWYASKELMGAFKKNAGKKVDENMVRNLPADNVNFLLALNFKAEAIREVLALTGMEGLISGLLKRQTGVSLDDLVKANKGDILIAGCNLRQERKTVLYGKGAEGDGYSYNKTEMDFLLATSINDKQAFNKLIQAGQDKSRELLGDDEISDSAKDQLPSYASNDKLFVFGNRKATVDNYLAGNGKNTTMLSLIGNKPIGGYADIQSILKGIEPEADADSTDREMYALTLQFWDNVALSGGDFEDGAMLFEAQINLKDKNTNSLKQLSTYGQKMAALEAAKRKKQEEEWGKLDPITPDQPTAPLPPPPSIYPKKRP